MIHYRMGSPEQENKKKNRYICRHEELEKKSCLDPV